MKNYQESKSGNYKRGNLLYVIAIVLFTVWAIGFLAFGADRIIHVLLAVSIVMIALKLINDR